MPSFNELIQQGSSHAWLFIPSAILLGALHGLEPGHSKTMMAAFIVAIRGTVTQAVLLGLAATVSHTAVVWGVALGGLYLWGGLNVEGIEPYFQLASAAVIIGIALWMLRRTWVDRQRANASAGGHARHHHPHHHHHDDDHHHDHGHGDHVHADGHDHRHEAPHGLQLATDGHQDAHELAHADDIRRQFADRNVTTAQIAMFGLTGGLIPCPAAITVLLLCLQLKALAVGATLVLCFSIGLALTLVTVGVAAALSVRHATRRWTWFRTLAGRAPYLSSALIVAVGIYLGAQGWFGLAISGA